MLAIGSATVPDIPFKCQERILGLAQTPIDICWLLNKFDEHIKSFKPKKVYSTPILPPFIPTADK